jgi:hypothetical protein
MHSYLLPAMARQCEEDRRRAARQYGPAGPGGHRLVTAAKTVRPGGEPMRSKPMILVALLLLLAAFR